jgi:hypothetical protein
MDETGVWHLLADRAGEGEGLIHATGRSLEPLTRNPDLLPDEPGLLAPHVVRDGMRYCLTAAREPGEILLSTTDDPYSWKEAPRLAFAETGACDPFLVPGAGGVWRCYYASSDPEDPHLPAICVRSGQNLKSWSPVKRVYVDPQREHTAGSQRLGLPSAWREGRRWQLMLQATPRESGTPETRILSSQEADRFAWGDKPTVACWDNVLQPRLAVRGTKTYLLRIEAPNEAESWTVQLGRPRASVA